MNRNAFEQEVEEFCRCWLVDHIDDYCVAYHDWDEPPDIYADISIEAKGRHYDLRMRIHPDTEGDIAIDTGDDSYLEAEGVDFYLWLWIETIRKEH